MVYVKGGRGENLTSRRRDADYAGIVHDVEITTLPVAAASRYLDLIGFADIVNSNVEWDDKMWNASPGDLAKACVLAMFMNSERPALTRIGQALSEMPLDLMFDTVSCVDDLNRHAISQMLDRVHEAGEGHIFMEASTSSRAVWGVKTAAVHSDTTSRRVYGEYVLEPGEEPGVEITRGYSKEHRPDLKQYMQGYAVNQDGVLLAASPLSGNTADMAWYRRSMELLEAILREEDPIYIADSKLVEHDFLTRLDTDGMRYLSRCPKSYGDKLQERTLARVVESEMVEMGSATESGKGTRRRFVEMWDRVDGLEHRLVVCASDALAYKGDKAVAEHRERLDEYLSKHSGPFDDEKCICKELDRVAKHVGKTIFEVEPRISHEIVETRPQGRPRKDGTDIRRRDVWRLSFDVRAVPERETALRRSETMIVLITNIPTPEQDPERGMTAQDVIRLYNREWRVESNFKMFKSPGVADALFLKDEGRAAALMMLMDVAVLVRGLMQLVMRRSVAVLSDEELPAYGYAGMILQRNITASFFVRECSGCRVSRVPGGPWYLSGRNAERAEFFLGLLGIDPYDLFSSARPRRADRKIPHRNIKG